MKISVQENQPIVSSVKNWRETVKGICSRFEKGSIPSFASNNFLRHPSIGCSLFLLDNQLGLFSYSPESEVCAISYCQVSDDGNGKFAYEIKVRSWCLVSGIWIHFRDGTILRSDSNSDHRRDFSAASKYCRSLIIKLAKAENREQFRIMLARSNRFCLKWTK